MEQNILITTVGFSIGARVKHALLNYRGLVLDVDPLFQHAEPLSQEMRESLPERNQPWYQVLVHGSQHVTYVAEQFLQHDTSDEDFEHPITEMLFTRTDSGGYQRRVHLQ